MMLTQCIRQPPKVSKADLALLKQHEVKYCANGYHSFCSVDHDGLRDLLQACVNIGAKYRKTDISESLAGCKAVSREASQMAKTVKDSVMYITREPIDDGSISPGIDMYMDDYRKKSLLDVHATWIDRNFAMDHAVPACNTSGSCAHGSEHRGSRWRHHQNAADTPVTTDHGSNMIHPACSCHPTTCVLEGQQGTFSQSTNDCSQNSFHIGERNFSSVGCSVSAMRSQLSADKVELLEFLLSGMRLGCMWMLLTMHSFVNLNTVAFSVH